MMTPADKFSAAFAKLPLVAILRGLTPAEAPAIGEALTGAGFGLLEVPLLPCWLKTTLPRWSAQVPYSR